MSPNRLSRLWTRRPRWVLTRPVDTVRPMNTDRVIVRGGARFTPGESLYSVGYFGELRPRLWQTLWYLVAPHHRLVPRAAVLGGMSENEFESSGHELTRVSRLVSVYAATRRLGLAAAPDGRGAVVTAVADGGPCDGLLTSGDLIVAADGRAVRVAADLAQLAGDAEGEHLVLTVLRAQDAHGAGEATEVRIPRRDGSGVDQPLGLRFATHRISLESDLDVEVLPDPDSSGPSAGLVTALAVIDVLTPGRLTQGMRVCATGTIDPYGRVGEVSGVGMKALAAHRAGMDLFLVPRGARAEALAALPSGSSLRVAEVATLDAAIAKLVALGGDDPVASPSRGVEPQVMSSLTPSAAG